jgi:hypothetical protein
MVEFGEHERLCTAYEALERVRSTTDTDVTEQQTIEDWLLLTDPADSSALARIVCGAAAYFRRHGFGNKDELSLLFYRALPDTVFRVEALVNALSTVVNNTERYHDEHIAHAIAYEICDVVHRLRANGTEVDLAVSVLVRDERNKLRRLADFINLDILRPVDRLLVPRLFKRSHLKYRTFHGDENERVAHNGILAGFPFNVKVYLNPDYYYGVTEAAAEEFKRIVGGPDIREHYDCDTP